MRCLAWGVMMAVAKTLQHLGETRDLYLFDTFAGMTEPTAHDVDSLGRSAARLLSEADRATDQVWGYAGIDDVQKNLRSTGYDDGRLHFVQGDVLDTVPNAAP